MKRARINIFLFVAVVLLLQIVLPAVESAEANAGVISGHQYSDHHSRHAVSPIALMKENEETERESEEFAVQLFQLIDFSTHPFLLSRHHRTKLEQVDYLESKTCRPALFTLNSTFLI